jgi:hypothetical protein
MLKRIIVGSAGGIPALNFIRSLRMAKEEFFLIGIGSNKFDLFKTKKYLNQNFLVPAAKEKEYLMILKQIIQETSPHFMHVQNDEEVNIISRYRDELGVKTYLPPHKIVELCQDKFKSAQRWAEAGLKVPQTFLIENEADLEHAFSKISGKVWLRAIQGAAGKWALPTDDITFAKSWINYYKGWGKVSASEYLSSDSVTWMSIWNKGKLLVAQGRKRLYWEYANRSISGVTGITGTGVTISDERIDSLAIKSINAIDAKPDGVYCVDLTYDKNGIANPTEINIGRFFTTSQFFSEAGCNMPYLYIKLAFGEKIPKLIRKINPLKPGLAWVRGMDIEPVLTTENEINVFEEELKKRLKTLRSGS